MSIFAQAYCLFKKELKSFILLQIKHGHCRVRKNGDIECYSGVLCVGELGGACVGGFS